MCQFLLSNKKYKYEEFFIDEYKELDEYMIYIEEKIWRLFRLDKILSLKPTGDIFDELRPNFNLNGDKSMDKVIIISKY